MKVRVINVLSSITLLTLTVLLLSACAPIIRPPSYVEVRNDYYTALSSEIPQRRKQLDALEQDVNKLLRQRGADPEMRILRANILLANLHDVPDPSKATQIIRDVLLAHEAASIQTDAGAWVIPRAYIVFGDLMLLLGRQAQRTSDDITLHYVMLSYYEIASSLYAKAHQLAEARIDEITNPSEDVVRTLHAQRQYARAGLQAALIGQARWSLVYHPETVSVFELIKNVYDIRRYRNGTIDTIEKWASLMPVDVLRYAEVSVLPEYISLDEILAGADQIDLEKWGLSRRDLLRSHLRATVLDAFLESPGQVPYMSSAPKVANSAANLIQHVRPMESETRSGPGTPIEHEEALPLVKEAASPQS